MTYATVCSGIEAMSVACEGLGLVPEFFSEIEPFECEFLSRVYPHVPNLGDMTKIDPASVSLRGELGILAGGTPCQDVSTAGTRSGMSDGSGTRSSLAFCFARLVGGFRPKWVLWENVEGSVKGSVKADFDKFRKEIDGEGYRTAYRVIDSSRYGIPQRRKRVWLVGRRSDPGAGGGADPEVLLERVVRVGCPPEDERERKGAGSDAPEGARICVDLYNGNVTGRVACTYGANSFGTNTAGPKLMVVGKGFRRFTPLEVERLFGFPDGYTLPIGRDSLRCKALGNSWPVPVAREIVKRITEVENG